MKQIHYTILLVFLAIGLCQAQSKKCKELEEPTGAAMLLRAMQGYENARDGMYPMLLVCGAEGMEMQPGGDRREKKEDKETQENVVKNSGTISYDKFVMIWSHIYDASLKVAKEITNSGEGRVPGIVGCRVNDKLREMMGNSLWNQFRQQATQSGISRQATTEVPLPKDICNKYSKPAARYSEE